MSMNLFAVTVFAGLVGLPSALLCVVLIVYLVVAPCPRVESRGRVAISRYFIYLSLAFAAIWFWMGAALPLAAWMFVYGDNGSWLDEYWLRIAAGIALVVSCIAFARGISGSISHGYIHCLTWVPPILLAGAGAVCVEEMLDRMEGITAKAAAQNMMRRFHKSRDSMQLKEQPGPPLFPDTPPEAQTFWIVENGQKIGLIMVWKNGVFGWKALRSHWFSDPTDILMDAKVYIDIGEKEKARYCLEQAIRALPGTPAEQEARRLLSTKLDRPNRQTPPAG